MILCSLGLFSAPAAHAHDPYEAFTSATIRSDHLELIITMAQSTALKLIAPTNRIRSLTPENIAEHRPRLTREGALLFIVTSVRTQLTSRKVDVELTDENDLVFKVAYPRPAPGRLLIHAAYLKRLGDGYGGIVEVDDQDDRNLGWDQLRWAQPSFEVTVPEPPPGGRASPSPLR
ncbi:MAG: hypothetical protein EXS37_09215 [Opitutus sp.]|nr:hypothetical protein [Opitutus sp.]